MNLGDAWEVVAFALIGKPSNRPYPRGVASCLHRLEYGADDPARVHEAAELLGIDLSSRSVSAVCGGLAGHGRNQR